MKKRNIGKELWNGLEEIVAWQKGQQLLKTTELKRLIAGDVVRIRKRGSPEMWITTLLGLVVLERLPVLSSHPDFITTGKIAVEKIKDNIVFLNLQSFRKF